MRNSIMSRLHQQGNMKENQMMNSRLEQSIKPFTTIRQQTLSASKYQQNTSKSRMKNKKGLSRVNSQEPKSNSGQENRSSTKISVVQHIKSSHQKISANKREQENYTSDIHLIETPLTLNHTIEHPTYYTYTREWEDTKIIAEPWNQLQIVRQKTEQNQQSLRNSEPIRNPEDAQRNNNRVGMNQRINTNEFVLNNKLKSLQSQVTILQQQNWDKSRKINQLQQKCRELEHSETQKLDRIKDEQYKNMELGGKLQKLLSSQDRFRIINAQLEDKCFNYEKTIRNLESNIEELQINTGAMNKSSGYKAISSQKQILQQDNAQLRQKYRQLLIKSSIVDQQSNSLIKKVQYYSKLITEMERKQQQLQISNYHLKEEVELAGKYYNELVKLEGVNKNYQIAKITIANLQQRIKGNQHMRADQTNYHFNQLRDYKKNQQKLYREIGQLQRINKQANIKQMSQLERNQRNKISGEQDQKYQKERIAYLQIQIDKKDIALKEINNDYEILISQMKQKINKKDCDHRIDIQQYQIQLRQQTTLKHNLIEELNKYKTLQKLNTKQFESHSPKKSKNQYYSGSLNFSQSRNNETESALKANTDLMKKIENYDTQIQNLQDKIYITQVQNEKTHNKYQTFQRKVVHLEQQLIIVESSKDILLNQKLRILEQLQSLKLLLKNIRIDNQNLTDKLNNTQQQLKQKSKQYNQNQNKLKQVLQLNREIEEEYQILQQRCQLNMKRITQYKQEASKISQQNLKCTEYIALLQNQQQIKKQKENINEIFFKEQFNKQLANQTNQQKIQNSERSKIYRQICENLRIVQFRCTDNDFQQEYKIILKISSAVQEFVQKLQKYINQNKHLHTMNKQYQQTVKANKILIETHKRKEIQMEEIPRKMQYAHQERLVIIKEDYDVVYAKYMKYRNMVLQCKNKHCNHQI